MTLWQTSLTCQIWVLLCDVYKDSNLHRLLAAAGRWCNEQIETSRILRPLCREGAAARAWESSLPCRALTALVNLPGTLLHAWYRAWNLTFEDSFFARLVFDMGDSAPVAQFWCIAALWCIPYERWNNAYSFMTGILLLLLFYAAGEAGRMLLREISVTPQLQSRVCCIIDDDPGKQGKYVGNVPIVGGREKIPEAVKKKRITQIILAIPAASAKDKKEILNICQKTGCRVRSLPGIYQLVNGEVSMAAVKDVQIEDLLGREPVKLDTAVLRNFLQGQTVLVTGGGGSIGSELCRQIAKYQPKQLIILDIYENNAYDIQQELRRVWGDRLNLRVEIASIRDKEKVYSLFQMYRPDIVLHAAAHKHVPLMEECPEEAIKNNIFGTYHVVRAAEKFGVKKFVMISTDKAVNPTNFMGATKRFCEMILQSRADSPTEFCAVRFGNVLGSNGSVVPLFKKQIQEGGPVTITDRRIIRYFMTIPEAAQLVLEAGAMAKQSEIFVLDMGEPVKILELAENLIRLSGLELDKDITIQEIGLRPGEKLYEELLMRSETLSKTSNEKIFIEQQQEISKDVIMRDLLRLDEAVTRDIPPQDLITMLREMVPTYTSPEEINGRATAEVS